MVMCFFFGSVSIFFSTPLICVGEEIDIFDLKTAHNFSQNGLSKKSAI